MITISPVVEFYITNVCNLACRGCNRFNNYNFKGHQYWDDWAAEYEKWSTRLDLPNITIIGGEPTLHPELEVWASNLRRLWPNSEIMIQTNGTYQRPEHLLFWEKYRVGFGLSLHDTSTADELTSKWKNYAGAFDAFLFHDCSIIEKEKHWVVHNSNVNLAFSCCDMKYDHTMFNGKLFKCPTMAVLPEFQKQFDLKLDNEQQALLDSYRPLTADCEEIELQNFLENKNSPISQCSFCPQDLKWHSAI